MSEILETALSFNIYDRTVDTTVAFTIAPAVPTLVDIPFLFDIEGFSPVLIVDNGRLVRRRILVNTPDGFTDPI